MQSADPDNFFETDAAQQNRQRKAAKSSNKHGDPVVMTSKILAAIADPLNPLTTIFVAESAGCVRRVRLSPAGTTATYRGPRAPVTCVAVGGREGKTLFAGSWDKDVWSWDMDSTQPGRRFRGHTDFVKTLVCATVSGVPVLISGGADQKIMVWEAETGRRLHTMQDPAATMLAVQHLAVDPQLSTADAVVVASASSDPQIRRWRITLGAFEQLPESFPDRPDTERPTIREHETSVYKLLFDESSDDMDLWTASADGTCKCLARSRHFTAEDEFGHGDYVRAVALTERWVITAGRDENIKFWDRASGKLFCTLVGHYEEVTDLVILRDSSGRAQRVCSVSIDGTIRTWPLAEADLASIRKKMEEAEQPAQDVPEPQGAVEHGLTEEEEAELAELMDDD